MTEKGGTTSHVAILARSLEIPALLGMEGILKKVREGEAVILDGKEGRLIFSPDAKTQAAYQEKQQAEKEVKRKLKEMTACLRYNGWAAGRAFCQCRQSQRY